MLRFSERCFRVGFFVVGEGIKFGGIMEIGGTVGQRGQEEEGAHCGFFLFRLVFFE